MIDGGRICRLAGGGIKWRLQAIGGIKKGLRLKALGILGSTATKGAITIATGVMINLHTHVFRLSRQGMQPIAADTFIPARACIGWIVATPLTTGSIRILAGAILKVSVISVHSTIPAAAIGEILSPWIIEPENRPAPKPVASAPTEVWRRGRYGPSGREIVGAEKSKKHQNDDG